MDEITVRVFRTIACLTRLRILSHLARADEVAPTTLARELGVPLDLVCAHLRRLSVAGLILRRRSGAWCYCAARSPYGSETLSGKTTSWLREALRRPEQVTKNCGPVQVRNSSPADADARLHRLIFEAATAFGDVRRLQILRRLARGDAVGVQVLTRELRMSEAAVCRHTAKLIRRRYVNACRVGRCLAYRLAPESATPVHAALLEIVRATWGKEELRA